MEENNDVDGAGELVDRGGCHKRPIGLVVGFVGFCGVIIGATGAGTASIIGIGLIGLGVVPPSLFGPSSAIVVVFFVVRVSCLSDHTADGANDAISAPLELSSCGFRWDVAGGTCYHNHK